MSINNIGGMNPDNTNPNNQRRNNESETNSTSNSFTPTPTRAPANGAYGQYLVNQNYNISSSRVNDNDSDMQEIYEIDKEIYGECSSYESFEDFKSFIANNHLSTYALKDNNGNIVGYYNLEPVRNGELYIDSMGLKPQYRNTRKGESAINTAWQKIQEFAGSNNAETLSLHVDDGDTEQVELYEQLGFHTAETIPNFWGTGQSARFMKFEMGNGAVGEAEAPRVAGISSEIVNNDEELREIYDIDSEAFSEQDPFSSFEDYKNYLTERNVSVYSVKNDDNEMLGYYALEPAKNGNMYIYSIAMKPEYRNSRKGYKAIQESWQKIMNDAKNQGVERLSLHVDADNPRLKKMYEHFGFIPVHTERGYYNNGHDALYMECPVGENVTIKTGEPVVHAEDFSFSSEEAQTVSDNNSAEPDTTFTPTPTPAPTVEEVYNDAVQRAEERLEELQTVQNTGIKAKSIINAASYEIKGGKVFDEETFGIALKVADICAPEESEYWRQHSFDEIMNELKKNNYNGPRVRKDVFSYVQRFVSMGVSPQDISKILSGASVWDEDGYGVISTGELDKVVYIVEKLDSQEKKRVSDIMSKCKLEGKDGKRLLNTKILDGYKHYMRTHDSDYNISDVIRAATIRNEDGSEYFNRETFDMLSNYFDGKNQYGHPCEVYSEHILSQVYRHDVTLDFYMNQAPRLKNDDVFNKVISQYNKKEDVDSENEEYARPDVMNMAAMLKAISYRTYEEKTDYSTGEKYTVPTDNIDINARNILREYCQNGIPFSNVYHLANIMAACKEKTNPYSPEKFNPELLDKAIQLKEKGINEKLIPAIMEECKIEELQYGGRKTKTFNDDMFWHIIMKCGEKPEYITPDKIRMSKDLVNGKEVYRSDVFELLASSYVPQEKSEYDGGLSSFQIKYPNGDKRFNTALFRAWAAAKYPSVRLISEGTKNGFEPNGYAIEAYQNLRERSKAENWEYKPSPGGESDPVIVLIYACRDDYEYTRGKWNNKVYEHVLDLKDKGYNVNEIADLIYRCKEYVPSEKPDKSDHLFSEERYKYAMSLVEQGIDIKNAGSIASESIVEGKMVNPNTDKMIELYKLGSTDPVKDIFNCIDNEVGTRSKAVNEVAYERMKDVMSRGLESTLIPACRDKGVFSDRLYHLALDLQKRGYSPKDITRLMNLCHETIKNESTQKDERVFKQNIYNHIKDLEDTGINQENIFKVLSSCKYDNSFSEDAFSKTSELHNKGYDDKGIAEFLKNCSQDNKFFEPKYNDILELSKKHIDLRDSVHGDDYVIGKLLSNETNIRRVKNLFGEDIVDYAISMKIDGFNNFINKTNHLHEKYDSNFIADLKTRLDELPSPEQKVKRLRILGGLSDYVDQEALMPLVRLIKSPKMTEDQVDLANEVFTPAVNYDDYPEDMSKSEAELKEYEKRVDTFIRRINVPAQTKQTMYDFLMKERLDKSIERPKPIEEQKAQMEKNAQQMLINPKIPLEKKIGYIDEYKAKLKEMDSNPDKFLKPYIYPKPMDKLKKAVEAYVNIPNDDIKFSNTIKESMYQNMGIETTPELLSSINYDSKFFDKLFASQNDFKANFRKLIELKKMNMDLPLRVARLTLPEEGTEKYNEYQRLGLIEQIKSNLDTKRQIEEHGLSYDKWDSFDDNLRGETFTSEADPETEYKNLKYNVINIFQDELWQNIKPEETQKLTEFLEKDGFKIFNNELFKNGKKAEKSDVEKFINTTVDYISKDEYWKGVNINSDLPAEEIAGVTGFTDHIKGFQKRAEEIKNARTVSNIHFRLTNDDDIGRNIFFGNHVGCCNSVESSYAGYSAPMHLLNNYNRGVELVDEWGNSYGNSLCFFADVDDKLTFVIDSFEANGKLGSNPLVAEKLFEFAKQVCQEMGRSDAQIMVGPNYNNMDKSLLTLTGGHKIKVLGTVSDKTYCDSVGGKVQNQINTVVEDRSMHELQG